MGLAGEAEMSSSHLVIHCPGARAGTVGSEYDKCRAQPMRDKRDRKRQEETDVKGGGLELESEPHISLLGPKEPPGALPWKKVLATSIPASMRLREPYGSREGGD